MLRNPGPVHYKGTDTLRNPTAIVEVLSRSTEAYNRGGRFSSYNTIPSLREYLLLSTTHRRAERFVRSDADWLHTEFGPGIGNASFPVLTAAVAF